MTERIDPAGEGTSGADDGSAASVEAGEAPVGAPPTDPLERGPAADLDPEASAVPELAIEAPAAVPEPDAEAPADAPEPTAPDPTAPEAPRTVGRLIADALRTAGVRYAFTVPGESFLGLLDALGEAGIRVVATRHEGAAAFMAEAHGQLTGRPAAALGTRAVGSTNLGIGIHTARQDSAPMFALVGQVDRADRGREAFQEIDQVTTIGGLAKWAAEPRDATEIAATMAEAIRQALSGRPGPVLLSLPQDLLDEVAPADAHVDGGRPGASRPDDADLRATIELLASARRPVILAGGGVLRARTSTELLRFAELLQVPIIAAWRRADVISNDHPLYLGMAGYASPGTVRERLSSADAVLVIGSRLNEPTTFGYTFPTSETRWVHVDIDPARASSVPVAERTIAADARTFLRAANERLLGRSVLDAERVATRQAANLADRAAFEAASVVDGGTWDGPGVHPGRVITTLRRVLPDDAIITTDAGNFGGWAARGFRFRKPGTFVGPTSGAMGYGLPAAIAAALVHRDRPVVAIVGDGGFAMTMAELETAVREHAKVIVLVFDNERFGTIRMWQDQRGHGEGVATELGAVDFAAVGRALGTRGVRVERDEEFEPALRQALAEDRPTVIQLSLDRRWISVDRPATAE
ncbi:MAG TPA: thiamine pyrophosphate-dependent enzyme [Candidatus Saccharimonadales bacterium]|nr:thiamine pyrophosphate-dependent enzyme [Candidatus Saccharimonadales bacterium]